ncbi:hypothetical protein [Mycetocola miduiensis]|uniref:DUF4878 domain-containing protein n=1 Tax=Mycetocola miduiensis TaxID=995034 RepID=A0A1I5DFP6_9MICO|nr:hypothetical protein [Mycetocola miduiensis]SFN97947.1 hypothetical protein SAMN05216219_2879 [Mycetocola miduiensis]
MATDDKAPEAAHGDGSVPQGGSADTPQQDAPDQQAYAQGSAYAQEAYGQPAADQEAPYSPAAGAPRNPYSQGQNQNPFSDQAPYGQEPNGPQNPYSQNPYGQNPYGQGQTPADAYSQGAQQAASYTQGAYSQGAPQAGYPQGAGHPYGTAPAGYPQPLTSQRPPMDPRKKKKVILFSALAAGLVLLLIIGSVIIKVIGGTQYGPEAKVEAYLSAISQGKASEANKLVDPGVSEGAAALLSNDILKGSKALMKNPKVTDVSSRGDSAMVEVSYSIDGTVYDGILELSKNGKQAGVFDNWTIDKPLLASVYVYPNQDSNVSINGVDVDFGKGYELLAYPAAYEVGAPEGKFFEAETQTFVAATGSKASYESIALELAPTKELTDEIQAQVNQYMDTCATQTVANPENCNLRTNYYLHFSGEPTFSYKVVKYPTVTVNEMGTRFEADKGQASATASGELAYPGGEGTSTYTWDDWGISGSVVIDGDTVTIEEVYGF